MLSDTCAVGRDGKHEAELPASGQERVLSGGYDGTVRIWNMSSEIIATSPAGGNGGRQLPVKAVGFLSPTELVSSGIDRVIRVWKYKDNATDLSSEASISPALELYGHEASVERLAINPANGRILSASSDHKVGIWSSRKTDAPPAPHDLLPGAATATATATTTTTFSDTTKRRKLNGLSNAPQVPQRGPLAFCTGHTAPVSSVIFHANDSTVAYSASWDHTIRTWDLATASANANANGSNGTTAPLNSSARNTSVDTRTTAHPLLSLTSLPSLSLLAAGTSARHISLVDPRASATKVSVLTLRGHRNAVVALAGSPESEFGLVSASHDGTCRVWDVRSGRPGSGSGSRSGAGGAGSGDDVDGNGGQVGESIFVFGRGAGSGLGMGRGKEKGVGDGYAQGATSKVLDVLWDRAVGIVSCGEDKMVQINQGRDLKGGVTMDE